MAATAQPTWPDPPAAGPIGDGRAAVAAFRPEDVQALCDTVHEQVDLGHALYPQGGCTALDYGGLPGRPGVIVDTRGLDRLIDYPFADMTITVEAGMTLSALRAILAEKHQRVLVDAPHPDRATLGGIYATTTTGPRRYGAGRPRDQIIGVSFVTSEGEVVKGGGRVVKNVAGYDFPKLLTGSMGTLGIITQLTVKVRPIPEASAIAWIPFGGVKPLSDALQQLNTSGTRPIALDVLNASAARVIGQGLGLPADWAILVVGYEDNGESVRWQVDRLRAEIGQDRLAVVESAETTPLWEALTGFQARELGLIGFCANILPSAVADFLMGIDPDRWAIQAHAGNGIIHAQALGEWTREQAHEAITMLRQAAVRAGGNLIVARCPTEWKEGLRVWGEPRADWAIGERVRAALDPHGAMNPGRFVT